MNTEVNQTDAMKSKIRDQEFLKTLLKHDLGKCKTIAEKKSLELEDLNWKKKKAEFLLFVEKQKHNKYFEIMRNNTAALEQADFEAGRIQEVAKNYELTRKELLDKRDQLQVHLNNLKEDLNRNKLKTTETEQIVNILKKKNTALKRKLDKQRLEAEKQEHRMMATLSDLEIRCQNNTKMYNF